MVRGGIIRYTILCLWRTDVEGELATLWCDSPERQAITIAVDRIDSELRIDAHRKGTEYPDGLRALVIAPLARSFDLMRQIEKYLSKRFD